MSLSVGRSLEGELRGFVRFDWVVRSFVAYVLGVLTDDGAQVVFCRGALCCFCG